MIFFNGSTGSLGRFFQAAAQAAGLENHAISSRIEDRAGFTAELRENIGSGTTATLVLLAAKVSVPWCEGNPESTHQTNVLDTAGLMRSFLDFCSEHRLVGKVIYVSSAHLYSRHDGNIHESDPVGPRSVYARSKLEAEGVLRAIADERSADLRIARVFGLVAPGQPVNYILPALMKRARDLNFSGVPGLMNLRDYLDSRDVCQSLVNLDTVEEVRFLQTCPDRVLNIASGEGRTIRSILELCIEELHGAEGLRKYAAQITEAPPRADDVPRIVASLDRYISLFGTNPRTIPLERTIRDAND